jgi:hypothetical protein
MRRWGRWGRGGIMCPCTVYIGLLYWRYCRVAFSESHSITELQIEQRAGSCCAASATRWFGQRRLMNCEETLHQHKSNCSTSNGVYSASNRNTGSCHQKTCPAAHAKHGRLPSSLSESSIFPSEEPFCKRFPAMDGLLTPSHVEPPLLGRKNGSSSPQFRVFCKCECQSTCSPVTQPQPIKSGLHSLANRLLRTSPFPVQRDASLNPGIRTCLVASLGTCADLDIKTGRTSIRGVAGIGLGAMSLSLSSLMYAQM